MTSKYFNGRNIVCLLGGAVIDLTKTSLASKNVTLNLFATLGGCTLVFPSDWEIKIEASSVLGGICNKNMNRSYGEIDPKKP